MNTQEPKEGTRKLCPLMLLACAINENSAGGSADCVEERCAWWVPNRAIQLRADAGMLAPLPPKGRCGMAR